MAYYMDYMDSMMDDMDDYMDDMDDMEGGAKAFGPALPPGLKQGCRRGEKFVCAKRNKSKNCIKYKCQRKRKTSKGKKSKKTRKSSKKSKRVRRRAPRPSGKVVPILPNGSCPKNYRKTMEMRVHVSKKGRRSKKAYPICIHKGASRKVLGNSPCARKSLKQLKKMAKANGIKLSHNGKQRTKRALNAALVRKGVC